MVIFQDDNILLANKPFNMLSCKDKKGIDKDLQTILEEKINNKLNIINRLDRGVGGLVLFAKNSKTANALTSYMKEHSFEKGYLAIACNLSKEEDTLVDYIMKNQRQNISKIVNKNSTGAKEAILSYKRINYIELEGDIYSLLDVSLKTGRHHQIRVQLANANLPLYNDIKYNKNIRRKIGSGNIGLFCYKMAFNHPVTNEYLSFTIYPKDDEMFKNFYR